MVHLRPTASTGFWLAGVNTPLPPDENYENYEMVEEYQ